MAGRADQVWEHGEKIGSGWKCKYCREAKAGGGATRLKEHLAHRGNDVKDCPSVPKEVKAFFARELDKIKERKRERERQRHRSTAAARTQYVDLENEDDDPELQAVIHQSREEYEFRERAGARYERGGGSGSGQAGPLPRMLRSQTQVPERVKDYHLDSNSGPRQQRIDTGPWTSKGRNAKQILGRAWAKACHAIGIPGRKVDDPYFRAAIIETQKQGMLCVDTCGYTCHMIQQSCFYGT